MTMWKSVAITVVTVVATVVAGVGALAATNAVGEPGKGGGMGTGPGNVSGLSGGSDWPQWAGPNGNYTSPEKGLLREWPEGGPEVLWRAKIEQGWSSPSVAGNEVYVSSSVWENNQGDGR
jgi:hypothetical protein